MELENFDKMGIKIKKEKQKRRRKRVRVKVKGTSRCPRLSVFRSNKHIYAQLIDDEKGQTLAVVSDLEFKDKKEKKIKKKFEVAYQIGQLIAKKATGKKIKKVIFDRGGYKYHGLVKAVAEGAREGGLEF